MTKNIKEYNRLKKEMLWERKCYNLDKEEKLLDQMDEVWYKMKWWERWFINGRYR